MATPVREKRLLAARGIARVYIHYTEAPWDEEVDAFTIPVGPQGGLMGGLARAYLKHLGPMEETFRAMVKERMEGHKLSPDNPLLLVSSLPGMKGLPERSVFLATAFDHSNEASASNSRVAAAAIVRQALENVNTFGLHRIAISLLGSGGGELDSLEVAQAMLEGVMGALPDMEVGLEEVMLTTMSEEAFKKLKWREASPWTEEDLAGLPESYLLALAARTALRVMPGFPQVDRELSDKARDDVLTVNARWALAALAAVDPDFAGTPPGEIAARLLAAKVDKGQPRSGLVSDWEHLAAIEATFAAEEAVIAVRSAFPEEGQTPPKMPWLVYLVGGAAGTSVRFAVRAALESSQMEISERTVLATRAQQAARAAASDDLRYLRARQSSKHYDENATLNAFFEQQLWPDADGGVPRGWVSVLDRWRPAMEELSRLDIFDQYIRCADGKGIDWDFARGLVTEWRKTIGKTLPPKPATERPPPAARVHRDLWTTRDQLGYNLYARAIAEFIKHSDTEPPFAIAVQGPWGQGKTSMMRMIQSRLDPNHPDLKKPAQDQQPESKPLTYGRLLDLIGGVGRAFDLDKRGYPKRPTVWFNAWKYQNSEQIWAGLAHCILAQLTSRLSPIEREKFWLNLQWQRCDLSAVRLDFYRAILEKFVPKSIGAAFLVGIVVVFAWSGLGDLLGTVVSGGSLLGAALTGKWAWKKTKKEVSKDKLEGKYARYVQQPDYAGRMGFLHLVEEDMQRALRLLADEEHPVVVFVDDLDRCSPNKVAEIIEAINLFLAGNYPGCAFVLGIDLEVVAKSLEITHKAMIEKLGSRKGELGWRFMDKFVQLPFVIPRLDSTQRSSYLGHLLQSAEEAREGTPDPEQRAAIEKEAAAREQAREDLRKLIENVHEGNVAPDKAVLQAQAMEKDLADKAPELAAELGEVEIAAAAKQSSDTDPEVIKQLENLSPLLSDNPRMIKRFVNLYRFHRFIARARRKSRHNLPFANPEQIGRWALAIVRWPHFVRWIQSRPEAGATEQGLKEVIELAQKKDTTAQAWTEVLEKAGIEKSSWSTDRDLWKFLREEIDDQLQLTHASERGFW